ncbi:MAG: TetR/AcrR family transcriptional regulator [Candidatus Thorarchaeota archaeon]
MSKSLTAKRKKKEKEIRTNTIIYAADELFSQKGVENTSMDDIVEATMLSKGTLYNYFSSKQELLYATVVRKMDRLLSYFSEAVSREGTGLDKIRAIGEAYTLFFNEYPQYFTHTSHYTNIKIKKTSPYSQEFNQKNRLISEMMIGTIQQGITDGSIREDILPLETSIVLSFTLRGLLDNLAQYGDDLLNMFNVTSLGLAKLYFNLITSSLKRIE